MSYSVYGLTLGHYCHSTNRIMELKEPINVETNGFEVVSPLARIGHNTVPPKKFPYTLAPPTPNYIIFLPAES